MFAASNNAQKGLTSTKHKERLQLISPLYSCFPASGYQWQPIRVKRCDFNTLYMSHEVSSSRCPSGTGVL
eukprot:2508564-Amphidinium_carterae.1